MQRHHTIYEYVYILYHSIIKLWVLVASCINFDTQKPENTKPIEESKTSGPWPQIEICFSADGCCLHCSRLTRDLPANRKMRNSPLEKSRCSSRNMFIQNRIVSLTFQHVHRKWNRTHQSFGQLGWTLTTGAGNGGRYFFCVGGVRPGGVIMMEELLHQSIGSLSHYLQYKVLYVVYIYIYTHPRPCRISFISN